jgi:hypothetical protein
MPDIARVQYHASTDETPHPQHHIAKLVVVDALETTLLHRKTSYWSLGAVHISKNDAPKREWRRRTTIIRSMDLRFFPEGSGRNWGLHINDAFKNARHRHHRLRPSVETKIFTPICHTRIHPPACASFRPPSEPRHQPRTHRTRWES